MKDKDMYFSDWHVPVDGFRPTGRIRCNPFGALEQEYTTTRVEVVNEWRVVPNAIPDPAMRYGHIQHAST